MQQHAVPLPSGDRRFFSEAFKGDTSPVNSCTASKIHGFTKVLPLRAILSVIAAEAAIQVFRTETGVRSAPEFAWIPAKDMRE